MTGSDDSENSF